MTKAQINVVDSATWATTAATLIMATVAQTCQACGSCTVMLTGGRSAERLYEAWAASPEFAHLRDVHFYFGDERCVPPDHPESNYGLAMRTLFKRGVPQDCTVTRMPAERPDHEAAAEAYSKQLPSRPDVMLLSVGEDGHIASLFPYSSAFFETQRRVVPISAPKPPPERLTVTPLVIAQVTQVFVMALGSAKAAIFQRAQTEPNDILALPARLVLNATWFVDVQLAN
jgi:6-phosphogluconolactonase